MQRPLRIGLNLLPFHPGVGQGGSEVLAHTMCRALAEVESPHRFTLIVARDTGGQYLPRDARFDEIALPFPTFPQVRRVLLEQVLLPRISRNFDVLYSQFVKIFAASCPQIIAVHDLVHIRHPAALKPWYKHLYWRPLMPLSAWGSDRVLTISEFAAAEIRSHFRLPAERVEVIYPGFRAPDAWDQNQSDAPPLGSVVSGEYFLCSAAANFSPHKNIPVLLKAFKTFSVEFPDIKLVITGTVTQAKLHAIEMYAAGLLRQGTIVLSGFASPAALRWLYQKALACVVPSLYEGFGLPVIEAQSLGCPVIVSDGGALPEVMDDPAFVFEGRSPDALLALLRAIVLDPSYRERAVRHGRANVRRFDPAVAARRFVRLCEDVASPP